VASGATESRTLSYEAIARELKRGNVSVPTGFAAHLRAESRGAAVFSGVEEAKEAGMRARRLALTLLLTTSDGFKVNGVSFTALNPDVSIYFT